MSSNVVCPSPEELTRALAEGASRAVGDHLDDCDACRDEWERFERLVELGRELPAGIPEPSRVEAVRGEVLGAAAALAATGEPRRRVDQRWWIVAAAAAVVALALTGRAIVGPAAGPEPGAPEPELIRATVHPHGGAEFILAGAQPDEIVRLTSGTITVEVEPLAAGERFRVVTGSGEVEVRGTVFDVTAEQDRLTEVKVISGAVAVRPAGRPAQLLSAGTSWRRDREGPSAGARESVAAGDPDVAPPAAGNATDPHGVGSGRGELEPDRGRVPKSGKVEGPAASAEEVRGPSPAEAAFKEGWAALRGGNPRGAAKAFERAIAEGRGEAIVEDASFWRAVAHARAGQTRASARALHSFLQRYPASPRRGEAFAMLGWQLYDAGELDAAAGHFTKALTDPVPRVRSSARQGLEAVANQRGR